MLFNSDKRLFSEEFPTRDEGVYNSSSRVRSGGALYIHIPFCKKACYYCDFHFSTSLKKKKGLVEMLCLEIKLRKGELPDNVLKTVYFGGGTPSLLSREELQLIFKTIRENFILAKDCEITLEANPDDIFRDKLELLKSEGINRLSIGVQSFFEEDLKLMNRAHNASEALESIKLAKEYFDNISIDLIYGIPGMTEIRWSENIKIALNLGLPHFSCYALTVEPNTALKKFIERGIIKPVDDEAAQVHFQILTKTLNSAGYIHYEFSNFGKPGYFSQNNTAYWMGKPYLGIGPSAHSFNGDSRRWNISNNTIYIKSLEREKIPFQEEKLSLVDKYNEYVMTRLRTMWGVSLLEVKENFGEDIYQYMMEQTLPLLRNELIEIKEDILTITKKGKFLSDGIAADMFMVNLE